MTPSTRGYALLREAPLSLAVDHEFTRPLVDLVSVRVTSCSITWGRVHIAVFQCAGRCAAPRWPRNPDGHCTIGTAASTAREQHLELREQIALTRPAGCHSIMADGVDLGAARTSHRTVRT